MLSTLRHYKYLWVKRNWFQQWLKQQSRRNNAIDQTVEICGLTRPYEFMTLGEGCSIGCYVSIYFPSESEGHGALSLGNQSFIGRNTMLGLFDSISIGANALIAPYCFLITGNHRFERRDIPIREQGHRVAPITIEDDVWLGTQVTVLPGVTIGTGAIVAAGSIVNRDIPPYQIWGGVPAKYIKERP